MAAFLAQLGLAAETTWSTAVTPSRFFEFNSESLELDAARIESDGIRAGTYTQRSDRFGINRKGAGGSVTLEVHDKGFGVLLPFLLGSVATTGPTGSVYTHTGTVASLNGTGKSFTLQIGKPFIDSTIQPFTYNGCKVTSWELSNSVDGILLLTLDIDAQNETTATALATASYPSSDSLLTFNTGQVTVGGSALDVTNVSVKCDEGLKTDRYFLNNSGLKKEQLQQQKRVFTIDFTVEFADLTTYNRYASATAAGAIATFSALWSGPTANTGMTVAATAARIDGKTPAVSGPDGLLMQDVTAKVLFTGSGSPLSIAYATLDVTP